jgi:hypothetical protein
VCPRCLPAIVRRRPGDGPAREAAGGEDPMRGDIAGDGPGYERTVVRTTAGQPVDPERLRALEDAGWQLVRCCRVGWLGSRGYDDHHFRRRKVGYRPARKRKG